MVPQSCWPDYVCEELNGQGWIAHVTRVDEDRSTVKFVNARRADGARWRQVTLASSILTPLDASRAAAAGAPAAEAP